MALAASVLCADWQPAEPSPRLPVLGVPDGPYLAQTEPAALAAFEAQVAKLQRELGADGGYIIGSAKPIMKDVPTANAVAFLEAVEPRLKTLRGNSVS